MAYTTLEKMRLEEYKRNKELQKSGGSSINMPTSTINSNITLPTAQSGTWFKKAQGNIIQNTLGTTGDALLNFGKGINSIGEGVKNFVGTAFINAASPLTLSEKLLTGEDHLEEWRNKATQDVLNFNPVSDVLDNATEKVDKYSVLGDKSDGIAQGIGYYGGMVALETLGIPWQATSAVTGFGNSYEEAINEGSSRESAVVYSLGSAAAEVASEYLFSGLKLPGTGKTTDKLIEAATDKIRNKVANQLVKFGVNSVGEGVEELISGTASEVMKRLTYMKDEDKNMFQNIGAGINDYYKNQALDEFVSGVLVSAITGASNNLINRTQSTNKNTNLQLTDNSTKNSLSENVITNNNLTNENLYQYIESDNEKINNLRKSAVEIGNFVNNDETTGVMNVAEKLISDKNYNIVFDNTITNENRNMVNAQITTLENGETEIRLNPNSDRAAEFLLIHEVSHGIKTQEMIDLVNDYASKNPEFNQAVKSLEQLYGKDLTSEEVFADVCGQLFGNQEFIMNLSTTKPSIFRRIYNKIVELANKITGNSNEALFIKNLKNKWENAYRTQNNNLDETKYMITGLKGVKNGIKVDSDNQWALDSYNKAQEMVKRGYSNEKVRQNTWWFQDKNGDWKFEISDENAKLIKSVKNDTNYRLDEILKHDTLFEMYPKAKKIKIKFVDIENVTDPSGKSHELNGRINKITNTISLNNKLISQGNDTILNTLIHEIQHYVQKVEKFKRGISVTLGEDAYKNNLGEIEAKDTSKRRNLTERERMNIAPKSSVTQSKKSIDKNKFSLYNNDIEEKYENNNKNKELYKKNVRGDILHRVTKELDNSSFSYSKNDTKWQEHLEKNYKATGTRTYMKNLVLPKVNKVKQNTTTNKNTQIRQSKENVDVKNRSWVETVQESKLDKDVILEAMKDYDYSYIPDSNKKQWNRATESFNKNGYEASVKNIISNFEMGNKFTADDLVLAQKLMQEASSIKDVDTFRELLPVVSTVGTELGQAVQSLSVIKKLSPEGQLLCLERTVQYMNKNVKGAEDVKITNEMAKKILDSKNSDELLNNMDEVKKQIAKQLPTTLEDKLTAWRYLSMLGSLRTHVRNIVSNFAMKETANVKNSIARGLETILDKRIKSQGLERTKTFEKPSQAVKEFANNYTKDSSDALKNTSKYTLELEMKKAQKIFGEKGIGGFIQKLYDVNSTALEFEDSVFRNSAFKKSLAEYLTANNIKTQQDIDNNPKLVNNAVQYATEESLKATFQQFNALSSALNSLRNKGSGYKLVIDALVPFKKTPANILSTGASYSPLGLAKSIFYDTNQLRNGNITTTQYIDNISKGLTGTGIMLLGLLLAELGILSSGDSDDKEDEYDVALGKQEYAINIGNQSITLDWLSPVAMPLFVGAEISNMKNNGTDNAFNFDTVTGMLTSTFDPLMSMSLLQGLNNALSGYSDNKLMAVFEESLISYVGQFFPTIGGQIAKTLDPTIRSTSVSQDSGFTLGERILRTNMAKIPGITYLLEPSLDIWGNEKQRSDNVITRAYENFIAPYSRKEMKTTEIDKELKNLYSRTGEDSIIPSTYIKKYIMFKEQKYETNAKTYTQYKKTYGGKASTTLESLFKTNTYKEATDEDKIKMINRVYDYANDEAKKEFLETKGVSYTNAKKDNIDIYKENVIIQAIDEDVSIEAINYKNQNPEKYKTFTYLGISYKDYCEYQKAIKEIKDKYDDIENPYTGNKAKQYKNYISTQRKKEIYNYINSLRLNQAKKLLVYNLIGGYSISSNKNQMFNYINNQNITKTEKQEIWKYLYK